MLEFRVKELIFPPRLSELLFFAQQIVIHQVLALARWCAADLQQFLLLLL
jgi:hypothetical protein